MKARIKATGEVINVEINKSAGGNQLYIGRSNWDGVEYTFLGDELEPINESIKCDWQQVRIQAAIAAMQAYISDGERMALVSKKFDYDDKVISKFIAEGAVMYADALIAKLKEGGEE